MNLEEVKSEGMGFPARKRVGRGRASGTGGTSGRGHKGYGARSGAPKMYSYEGGQTPYFRRLPKRGFSNAPFQKESAIVNVGDLNRFSSGDAVDMDALVEKGLVRKGIKNLRVLAKGTLEIPLTVTAPYFSEAAERKIREAGGETRIA